MTVSPTLVQQNPKQGRRHHLAPSYPDEEDKNIPLQCHAQHLDGDGSDDDVSPLQINPALPAESIALLMHSSAGMDVIFSEEPVPLRTSDAASRYRVLQIFCPPLQCRAQHMMDDDSDEGDHHASGIGHAGQNREESHGLYHARAPSQPGNNGGASSHGDHAGQSREESHELNHARASSQPGNNGEALPDAVSSEASRPLRTSDAAAHHHALLVLNPPDSDESEDSELTPEELIEAIIESTCMNALDNWGPKAIDLF